MVIVCQCLYFVFVYVHAFVFVCLCLCFCLNVSPCKCLFLHLYLYVYLGVLASHLAQGSFRQQQQPGEVFSKPLDSLPLSENGVPIVIEILVTHLVNHGTHPCVLCVCLCVYVRGCSLVYVYSPLCRD